MPWLTSWQRFVRVAILLIAAIGVLSARSSNEVIPQHQDLSSFPVNIDRWEGTSISLTPGTLGALGAGDFLVRDYRRSPQEPRVNLYIAFFPSQRTGDTIHSPNNCLPGAGWAPIESGHVPIRSSDGSTVSINRYIIGKGQDRDLVLYWFQAHGRITPSDYWARIYLVTDALRMNRTDGALVRILTPIVNRNDAAPAEARAAEFINRIVPMLDSYIPR